ncbi:putative leucine-rich repeat-containing protein DDB_G0290503 [Drosophila guanche]|uniref:Blast:Janus kinase and microtubule-interacting protein 1 n=1 Tax=Drosophila guanche TaxID=7266 RepID=A0A3B0KEC1_DROGU|nr:putative leucine-rich repeat-containing protein DDB_G0290503 [Drosophila guanche]SPP84026.1 blast:Janus kinase and microtubule-interacting protein 1 [Drosophila guanche]
MAENQTKTTSSKGFNEKRLTAPQILRPHNAGAGGVRSGTEPQSRAQASFPEDWQTLVVGKNKLKRKKKLSTSLTSVGDTVNQEKRTRIEGIHLQCRGKLRAKDTHTFEAAKVPNAAIKPAKTERPPVIIGGVTTTNVTAVPPQRIKRKLQENLDTIQKLNALTEQLRLEVNELKSSLITERGAVRALRAQNDADSRKWKNDVKKLQHTLDVTKKCNGSKKPNELANEANNASTSTHVTTADGLINYEIQRLTNEIAVLKEANKTKEEKSQIIGQADRLKAADMRQLKNAYENRLTQIQKSAKIEITRLLEEIKTKERNIGQLKKDLLTLQGPPGPKKRPSNEAKMSTTMKHKTNETSQKPKKPTTIPTTTSTTSTISKARKAKNEPDTNTRTTAPNPIHQAQVTPEITQLKNIELINNTKNAHKSTLEMRTTLKSSNNQKEEQQQIGATTWMTTLLNGHATARTKDNNNSDTDSALSSAPPSISPQPPSSGSDSGVIWQTLQDLDKLQKEAEMYHKENERLQAEVQLMKQELESAEKAAISHTHINELMHRIKELEEQQMHISDESNELREQNELLEFRILELEDDSDKMDSTCEGHCQRLQNLLEESAQHLEDRDKRCLQQLLQCVQQLDLDAMMPSGEQTKADQRLRHTQSHNRIVATVQPYSNCCAPPSAPPTPSKRSSSAAAAAAWQSSSLSESGVFVECDLSTSSTVYQHPHLQYYQERLDQLERKILVYESAGETQAQHLSQRLQREVLLEKEARELSDRVRQLIEENALLEEAKCEFEEAENDTRLHLQRNEVELEITRQRNVELEFSKDALSAKYKDCRAECLILREDLAAAETQLEHLHEERQRTKRQLEALRRSLPLLLICRLLALAKMGNDMSTNDSSRLYSGQCDGTEDTISQGESPRHSCDAREVIFLREEVKVLRSQLKDLNSRHYEAMESADSHWAEQEQEYKEREEAYLAKEVSLKQKIGQLQDCLREDSRAAAEKIQQLEETEMGLKTCLMRLTKEHRDLLEDNRVLRTQVESHKAQEQLEAEQQMAVALESEKRRCQALIDDLSFAQKLQASTEEALKQEAEGLRSQMYDLRKSFMHIEVTNGELKEEVGTLENKIRQMESQLKESEERARCLEDELRTKDELCQRMEREIGVIPEGFSLAHELYDSPAKRVKREEIKDLQSASLGLGCALREQRNSDTDFSSNREFQVLACNVKQLADHILASKNPSEVSTMYQSCHSDESLYARGVDEVAGEGKEGDVRGEGGAVVQVLPKPQRRSSKVQAALRRYRRLHAVNSSESKNEEKNISELPASMDVQSEPPVCVESLSELPASIEVASELPASMEAISELPASMEAPSEPPVSMETLNEVPASMQTLTEDSFFDADEDTSVLHPEMEPNEKLHSMRRKRKSLKRYICSRIYRGLVRRRALQRSLSSNSFHSMSSIYTLHSDTSFLSLRSQHASCVELPLAKACCVSIVQTESMATCAQEVQAAPETSECDIQCDLVDVEQRLLLLPDRTRRFVELLQSEVQDVQGFRARLLQEWESSESFRENIERVQDLYWTREPEPLESMKVFVSAKGGVRDLATILQPKTSFTLNKIEQRINERLVMFHCKKELRWSRQKRAEKMEALANAEGQQSTEQAEEDQEMEEQSEENQERAEQAEHQDNAAKKTKPLTHIDRPNNLFELMGVGLRC